MSPFISQTPIATPLFNVELTNEELSSVKVICENEKNGNINKTVASRFLIIFGRFLSLEFQI
ncbi:hypothetical protein GCM10011531_02370 [Aquaticitalea lipolytica]|uniref:Uncharacterized protein n=1 Tax=Aquaticitalea lipolytica TaxID=1247562 RepID=A0A8J2XE83_9FLAO|nr:hypothetical protein GCM10011531_02370 [Aquaticitalea lipolytica]